MPDAAHRRKNTQEFSLFFIFKQRGNWQLQQLPQEPVTYQSKKSQQKKKKKILEKNQIGKSLTLTWFNKPEVEKVDPGRRPNVRTKYGQLSKSLLVDCCSRLVAFTNNKKAAKSRTVQPWNFSIEIYEIWNAQLSEYQPLDIAFWRG